ncbi:hypothetical protein COLO4_08000 [Corchorus olitorius]|uniref:Uncharacterized protein n=1 Tax=Corchorus olitorius TaxID=93759 RepID=A0A1R3KI26_9ROSI|nr:hypothetical protein COLO4_08000 [Corchorus olitorius]
MAGYAPEYACSFATDAVFSAEAPMKRSTQVGSLRVDKISRKLGFLLKDPALAAGANSTEFDLGRGWILTL